MKVRKRAIRLLADIKEGLWGSEEGDEGGGRHKVQQRAMGVVTGRKEGCGDWRRGGMKEKEHRRRAVEFGGGVAVRRRVMALAAGVHWPLHLS